MTGGAVPLEGRLRLEATDQDLGGTEVRTDRKLSPPFFCTVVPTSCSFSLWGFREQAVHV